MGHLAVIPTPGAIEAAWERYASLMRAALDNQQLLLNRRHMEEAARAEQAWKEAFLASETGR